MNWGLIMGIALAVSGVVFVLMLVANIGYGKGHLDGYRAGLKDKRAIEEKYK